MNTKTPRYHGYRFPPEIISHAVWLYYRFCLSFRDVEDLLAERGVIVSYETIRPAPGFHYLCPPKDTRSSGTVRHAFA